MHHPILLLLLLASGCSLSPLPLDQGLRPETTDLIDAASDIADSASTDAADVQDAGIDDDRDASPVECGAVVSSSCAVTLGEADCVAHGGAYVNRISEGCLCPASDQGCPCSRSDECEGSCVAEGSPSLDLCESVRAGVCTHYRSLYGCFCLLGPALGVVPAGQAARVCTP